MPISGVEAYFREDRTIREDKEVLREYYHMTLLAINLEGWHNLLRITSDAWEHGFYGKACCDYSTLEKHNAGLVCLTACVSGFVPWNLAQGEDKKIKTWLNKMRKIFGDRLFVEIMPHGFDQQRTVNTELINWAGTNSVPVVATTDAHYPYADWHDTHEVLWLCSTGSSFQKREEEKRRAIEKLKAEGKGEDVYDNFGASDLPTLYLMSEDEVAEAFARYHPDIPVETVRSAMDMTNEIAGMVQPYLVDKGLKMPAVDRSKLGVIEPEVAKVFEQPEPDPTAAFGMPEGETWINDNEFYAECVIRQWLNEGYEAEREKRAKWGYEFDEEEARKQDEYELSVFREKGVLSYFVVIGEAVRWCKKPEVGIRVGLGRGSAAGSRVLYGIGVTGICPIGHGLLFERFMNPARSDMPDVDLDFQHKRRHEVKHHVGEVWGHDNVADIISHQTFGIRSALQAVGRVYDVDYGEMMSLTKHLDDGHGDYSLQDVYEISKELRAFADKHPDVWKHALRLEGQIRAKSKHAAGIVITDKPVSDYMPTMRDTEGGKVTAWSEQADFPIISKYGFLKIDFLGLDGLTVQDTALRLIEQETGERPDIDALPFTWDPDAVEEDVIQAFGTESTIGIFQFEGTGIRGLLRSIKPTSFRDLVAANALYRPGPLESGTAFSYGHRKNGKEPTEYWAPALEEVLSETHGIMVYQEQAIRVAQVLAGYTPAEADIIRKTLTKLSSAKVSDNAGRIALEELTEDFVARGMAQGHSETVLRRVIEELKYFTRYSFNKSHSAGYSGESYQDMWLKKRYPKQLYASLMTWKNDKVPVLVRDARSNGVKVLPPDVNTSGRSFTIDGDSIRYGLEAVKNVADASIQVIAKLREDGPFESLEDMAQRVSDAGMAAKCNSRVRSSLMCAGAMDTIGERRDGEVFEWQEKGEDKQLTWSPKTRADKEREYIGIALSEASETVEGYRDILRERVHTLEDIEGMPEGEWATIGGELTRVNRRLTKTGQPMAFLDVTFGRDQYSGVVFADVLVPNDRLFDEGNIVLMKGKVGEDGSMVVAQIVEASTLRAHLEQGEAA